MGIGESVGGLFPCCDGHFVSGVPDFQDDLLISFVIQTGGDVERKGVISTPGVVRGDLAILHCPTGGSPPKPYPTRRKTMPILDIFFAEFMVPV